MTTTTTASTVNVDEQQQQQQHSGPAAANAMSARSATCEVCLLVRHFPVLHCPDPATPIPCESVRLFPVRHF